MKFPFALTLAMAFSFITGGSVWSQDDQPESKQKSAAAQKKVIAPKMVKAAAMVPVTVPGVDPSLTNKLFELSGKYQEGQLDLLDELQSEIDQMFDPDQSSRTRDYLVSQKIRHYVNSIKSLPQARQRLADYVNSLKDKNPDSEETATAVGMQLFHLEIETGGPSSAKEKLIDQYVEEYGDRSWAGFMVYRYGLMIKEAQGDDAQIRFFEKNVDRVSSRFGNMIRKTIARSKLVGSPADLAAPTVSGDQFDIADLEGKVVLIDFWATWCGPCIMEMPELKELYDEYRDAGFEIVGYSLDRDADRLNEFLDKKDFDWIQLYAEDPQERAEVLDRYGVAGVPATILVDQTGKIVAIDLRGHDKIESAIKKLLAKP